MRRSALLVICLAVFVDMLGFGIILPLLPFHTEDLGGSGLWVGALLTAYSAAQLVGAPVLGALSDRYGRRRLLLASLAGSVVSLAVTGLAGSLGVLLGARVVAGLFGGAIAVAQAYVVDLAPVAQRTRALGMIGASIGLGFVFGPGIGGLLGHFGFATASLVAAGIALANLLAGIVLLPRSAPRRVPAVTETADGRPAVAGTADGPAVPAVAGTVDAPAVPAVAGGGYPGNLAGQWSLLRERLHRASPVTSVRAALGRPALRGVLGALFAAMFAFTSMEATFALLGAQRYGLTTGRMGLVFSAVGVVMAVTQGGMVGRLADRFGDRRIALSGALLTGSALLALPFGPAWTAYTCLGLIAVGQGLLQPTLSVLIAARGGRELGGVFGVGQAVSAMARGIGPIIAGFAFDVAAPLPYVLAALAALVAVVLLSARVQDRALVRDARAAAHAAPPEAPPVPVTAAR